MNTAPTPKRKTRRFFSGFQPRAAWILVGFVSGLLFMSLGANAQSAIGSNIQFPFSRVSGAAGEETLSRLLTAISTE